MDCCGFSDDDEGYKAWNNNMYFNCTDDNKSAEKCAVPWSCCVLKDVRHPYSILHPMSWRDIVIFASNLFYVMSSKTQGATFLDFSFCINWKDIFVLPIYFITLNFIALYQYVRYIIQTNIVYIKCGNIFSFRGTGLIYSVATGR